MNDPLIVTVYVILDDLLRAMGHRTDCRALTSDSDAAQWAPVTVGAIIACRFANHHEHALGTLRACGYRSAPLPISPFNRRSRALGHWFARRWEVLAQALMGGEGFTIDRMPLLVCRQAGRGAAARGAGRNAAATARHNRRREPSRQHSVGGCTWSSLPEGFRSRSTCSPRRIAS